MTLSVSDYEAHDATGLAELVRNGEIGPREVLAEGVRRMMIEVDPAAAEAGALVLFRMKPRAIAKHVGIISDPGSFIHAYERLGVIEEPLSSVWRRRIAFAFLFPRPSASVRKQARRKRKS